MLRAVDQFHTEFRAYPGFFKDQVETDIVRLKVCGMNLKFYNEFHKSFITFHFSYFKSLTDK